MPLLNVVPVASSCNSDRAAYPSMARGTYQAIKHDLRAPGKLVMASAPRGGRGLRSGTTLCRKTRQFTAPEDATVGLQTLGVGATALSEVMAAPAGPCAARRDRFRCRHDGVYSQPRAIEPFTLPREPRTATLHATSQRKITHIGALETMAGRERAQTRAFSGTPKERPRNFAKSPEPRMHTPSMALTTFSHTEPSHSCTTATTTASC